MKHIVNGGRIYAEVKYIDPTYMIRAIKPNANDSPLGGIVFRN